MLKRKKIALVLGGGSARGMAHIGVLKVLKEEGMEFDFVVGTSIGSLLGSAYALGVPLAEMQEKALAFTTRDLLDFTIPKLGLMSGKKLERIIRRSVGMNGFKDMKIPMYIVTTDIERGQEVVLSQGDLVNSIKASCSLPGIFSPVMINGRMLIDGGIIQSVPVSVAYELGADVVLAVDVGFCVRSGSKMTNMLQIIVQSLQIMGDELNNHQSRRADVVIRPELKDIDQLAFDQTAKMIDEGEVAARREVHHLRRIFRHPYKLF